MFNKGASTRGKKIAAGVLIVLLFPLGRLSVGGDGDVRDACEREALRAYWEALKLCTLAEETNPRLRCYEAAKSVYWHTLEQCRKGERSD